MGLQKLLSDAERYYRLGFIPKNKQYLTIAENIFLEILKKNPCNENTHIFYLNILFIKGHYEKMLEYCREKESQFQNNILFQISFSGALTLNGLFQDALTITDETIRNEPSNFVVWNNRGYIHNLLSLHENALSDLQKAEEFQKNNPVILSNLGTALRLKGKDDEAKEVYLQSIDEISKKNDSKTIFDYRYAIRSERGLYQLGIIKRKNIEQNTLRTGIFTQEYLDRFFKYEP